MRGQVLHYYICGQGKGVVSNEGVRPCNPTFRLTAHSSGRPEKRRPPLNSDAVLILLS